MKIFLHGRKRSGKDTLADKLVELDPNIKRWALAEPVKMLCSNLFIGINVYSGDRELFGLYSLNTDLNIHKYILDTFKVDCNKKHYELISKLKSLLSEYKSNDQYYISPRKVLEIVGTELFKNYVDPLFWIKLVPKDVNLITDVRFLDEFNFFKDRGYISVIIDKIPDYEITHISDTGLPKELFDIVFEYKYCEDPTSLKDNVNHQCKIILEKVFL